MTEEHLVISVSAAPLAGDGSRARAAVQGLERAFPFVRLMWEISPEGQPVAVRARDELIAAAARAGDVPLLCNGDEAYLVSISGFELAAGVLPSSQPPLLDLHADLPLDDKVIAAAENILEGMSDGVGGYWGVASPGKTAVAVAQQTLHPFNPSHPQPPPPHGLPWILRPDMIPSVEIPDCLGWLNYWSVAAAKRVGFPDPTLDAELLTRSRRTAAGAWIVKLTDAPLNLDIPSHLDALRRAYERFPVIGGRNLL